MPKTGENVYKRKDGRWEARFISGRKPDGRAKYTSVYARTYAAAKAKLEERKRMVVSPPVVNCRLTVAQLFAWYLAQAEIKPSTRSRYVFLIDHHILPYLGSVFVPALTAAQLTDFLNQKKQHGRLRGGGLSAKSVRDIGVLIKAALRLASTEYHFYCDALNATLSPSYTPLISTVIFSVPVLLSAARAVVGAMHSTIQRTSTMLSHCFFMISSSFIERICCAPRFCPRPAAAG